MLEVQLRKQRRGLTVEVEFAVPAGASLGLFGPSGAGKSTVLRCIAGLDSPDGGRIVAAGQPWFPPSLPLHRRPLGYLAQSPCLFPHLSVADNVTFALGRRAPLSPWIEALRARLRLEACWHAPARQLSGGQAQRVALARMLAAKPPLVLLDEPFSGLDRASVRELVEALCDWRAELGFTLLAVDHQAEVLEWLVDQVMFLDGGRATPPQSWASLRQRGDRAVQELLAPLQPPMRTMARCGLRNSGSPM